MDGIVYQKYCQIGMQVKIKQKPLWEALSKQYANGAEGSVKYVHSDGYVGNVFKTIEQPILLDKIGKGIVQFEEIVL